MPHRFYTMDVFTDRKLAGNPLAVVLDADDLSAGQMQAIAAEFNLAETVFICEPRNPINTARVRIFTIAAELPFAGHPTVGSAVLLGLLKAPGMLKASGGLRIVLEEKSGLVPCDVVTLANGKTRAIFTAPVLSHRLPFEPNLALISQALGISPDVIGFDAHDVSYWMAGIGYIVVPVKTLEALSMVRIADQSLWDAAFGVDKSNEQFASIYAYTRGEEGGAHDVRARMFNPGLGMPEDPATGSAVACFAGAALAFERPGDGTHQLLIAQGYEMGKWNALIKM